LVAARKNPTAKWSISDSKISVPYGAAFRREEDPDLLTTEFFKLKKKYLEFVDALVIREDNFSPTLIGDTIRKILIKLKCTEEQAFVAQFAFTEIFTNAFKGAANHLFKDVSFNFGRLADVKILGARLQAARSLRNHLISQTSLTVNIYNGGNTLKLAVNSPGMSQQSRLSLTRNLAHYQTMSQIDAKKVKAIVTMGTPHQIPNKKQKKFVENILGLSRIISVPMIVLTGYLDLYALPVYAKLPNSNMETRSFWCFHSSFFYSKNIQIKVVKEIKSFLRKHSIS
jgi:hypothetical protein